MSEPTTLQEPTRRSAGAVMAAWLLLLGSLVVAFGFNLREFWVYRWFPAWQHYGDSLYQRFTDGESYYTHGPLVPLVSLVIIIMLIRHTRIPVAPRPKLGLAVLGLSLLVHLAAALARINFVSGFALIGVLVGLVLVFWGAAALRRLWFPIVLLMFMVPLPEVTVTGINFRLKMLSADWGVRIANFLGIVVEANGNQVFIDDGQGGVKTMVVANVCNGLRTLISVIGFGAIYAYVCRLRGGWRLGLFAMAVPVAVVSNAIRIVSLIVVADIWDVATATGVYHDSSGLAIFVIAFLLMFGLEKLVLGGRRLLGRPAEVTALFAGQTRGPQDEGQWSKLAGAVASRSGFLAIALVLVLGAGAWWLNQSVPGDWSGAKARQALPTTLTVDGQPWQGVDVELDEQTLTILETRDYLNRVYSDPQGRQVLVTIIFSQDNRKGTHPPDVCLEGGGSDIVGKGPVTVDGIPGRGRLECRELLAQTSRQKHYFVYFYKCGDSYTSSFWVQQATIFWNGLRHRNATGALIRVSLGLDPGLEESRRLSQEFIRTTVPILDRSLP